MKTTLELFCDAQSALIEHCRRVLGPREPTRLDSSKVESTRLAMCDRIKELEAERPVWRDIATAPKDSTKVIGYMGKDSEGFVYCDESDCNISWYYWVSGYQCFPTLWMPIPAAPVVKEVGE